MESDCRRNTASLSKANEMLNAEMYGSRFDHFDPTAKQCNFKHFTFKFKVKDIDDLLTV